MMHNLQDVADIVDNEGLGYAIESYLDPSDIEDPELRGLWEQAYSTLAAIRDMLPEAS